MSSDRCKIVDSFHPSLIKEHGKFRKFIQGSNGNGSQKKIYLIVFSRKKNSRILSDFYYSVKVYFISSSDFVDVRLEL